MALPRLARSYAATTGHELLKPDRGQSQSDCIVRQASLLAVICRIIYKLSILALMPFRSSFFARQNKVAVSDVELCDGVDVPVDASILCLIRELTM